MVRFAEKKDLERVNEIRKQVNEIHFKGRPDIFKPGFGQEIQDFVYEMYNSVSYDIIVVERDGIICGMACVHYIYRTESPYNLERKFYSVHEFAIDKPFRRKGAGTELFGFIKKDAKNKGFPRIELDVWEFNEAAVKFYEAQGFSLFRRFMEYQL